MRPSIEAAKKYFKDNPIICAELGVSVGDNALDMLTNYPEIQKIHLVDNYFGINARCQHVAKEKLKKFNDKIVWHYATTVDAAKQVKDESLDFVYVDDGHADFEVEQDIRSWFPKLKKDGMMGGHDFNINGRMCGIEKSCRKMFAEINLPLSVVLTFSDPREKRPCDDRHTRKVRCPILSDWWVYKIETTYPYILNGILQKQEQDDIPNQKIHKEN